MVQVHVACGRGSIFLRRRGRSLPSTIALLARMASWCRRAYMLPMWFFLFSIPNLWGHWTDLNQTLTHIPLWLLFEKFGPNSPTGWGQRNVFLGPTLNFVDRLWTLTEHISATAHDINNRKETCQFTTTLLHAPNLVNFGPQMAENGWRVFCPPHKFSHWETLPALPHEHYITDSRQTLARVM